MTDPVLLQRLEGLVIAVAVLVADHAMGIAWWWPLALFLVVDLSALGYLVSLRVGAATYNAAHAWIGPAACGAAAALLHDADADVDTVRAVTIAVAAWTFHVAVDRAMGYGLKFPDAFRHTHLSRSPAADKVGP